MLLTLDELNQLNECRRKAKYENSNEIQVRLKLREELEVELAKYAKKGGKIQELESKPKPRPERVTGVFDSEYCGASKTSLIIRWLNMGGYNNGRRARLSYLTGVPIHRIYSMVCARTTVRLSNLEYNKMRKAMRQIEEIEKRISLYEH